MPANKAEDLIRLFEKDKSLFWHEYEEMWRSHVNELTETEEESQNDD